MKPSPPIWKTQGACPQNWNRMHGDDKRRFCDHCQKHVHNISAMTPAERTRLAETDNSPCIFYLQRKDGGVANLSLLAKTRRCFPFLRFVSWTASIALLSTVLSGCKYWVMEARCPDPGTFQPPSKLETNTPPASTTGNSRK